MLPEKKKKETTMWTNNETMQARRRMQAYWKNKGDNRFPTFEDEGNRLPLTGWKHHAIMDYGVARLGSCQVCPKKEIRYLHLLRHPGYANVELRVGCSHALFLCTGDERCNIYCPCGHFRHEWKRYWDLRQISPKAKPVKNMMGSLSTDDYGMIQGGFVVPNPDEKPVDGSVEPLYLVPGGQRPFDSDYKDQPLPSDSLSDSDPENEEEEETASLPDMTEEEILADLKDYNPRLYQSLIPVVLPLDPESEEEEKDPPAAAPLRRSKRKRVPSRAKLDASQARIKDLGPLLPDRSSRHRRHRRTKGRGKTDTNNKRQKAAATTPVIRTSCRIKARQQTITASMLKRKRAPQQPQPKTPVKRKRARRSPLRARRKLIVFSDSGSDLDTTATDRQQLRILIENQGILTQALLNQHKANQAVSQQRTKVMQVIANGLAEITKNLVAIFEHNT